MASKAVYRVGVIGGGRMGTHWARGYHVHPRTEVVAVADTDPENLELFCQRFDVPGYNTYDKMFANERIDISVPVLPVKANADAVVASARAGVRAVYCEKPLAGSLTDADRMVGECESRGIPLAAGLVVSSHSDYRKAYRMAAEGEIGEVVRINLYEGNDQVGTHGLNLARKFANKSDVELVIGFVENDPFGEYEEDYGHGEAWYGKIGGYIRFNNGIEVFSSFTGPDWRGIEVMGTRGVIVNSNNTWFGLHLWKMDEDVDPKQHPDLAKGTGVFKSWLPTEDEYDEEGWRKTSEVMTESISDVVESLDTGKPLEITTGDDLRHALEIAVAIRESARRGSAPVKLPIEDRNIMMYPAVWRWHYSKDVFGAEWYREQMKREIRRG